MYTLQLSSDFHSLQMDEKDYNWKIMCFEIWYRGNEKLMFAHNVYARASLPSFGWEVCIFCLSWSILSIYQYKKCFCINFKAQHDIPPDILADSLTFAFFAQSYFKDSWNTFDFVTVVGSIVDALMVEFAVSIHSFILFFYREVILIGAFWVCHTSKLRSDWNSNLNLLYLPTMSVFLPIEARRIETVSTLTLQKLFQHANKSTLVFLINVLQVYLFLKDLPLNSPLLGTIS